MFIFVQNESINLYYDSAHKDFTTLRGECNMVECEICGFNMKQELNVEVGEVVSCIDCGKEYEVKGIGPLKLDFAPELEEDWGE